MFIIKKIVFLLVLVLLLFCSTKNDNRQLTEKGDPPYCNKSSKWTSNHFDLVKEFEIGSNEMNQDEYIFGVISDIDVDGNNNIYVLDRGLSRIQKFNSKGQFLFSLNLLKGYGPGEFILPRQLAIDSLNNIFISDDTRRIINIFDGKGNFLNDFSIDMRLAQMSIGVDHNIYISGYLFSYTGPIIQVYSKDGKFIQNMGMRRKDSDLIMWTGNSGKLCIDIQGDVLYSFSYPYDIRKFSSNGELINRFGRKVSFYRPPEIDIQNRRATSFSGSRSIAVLPNNNILHIIFYRNNDDLFSKLDIFSDQGIYLNTLDLTKSGIRFVRNFLVDNDGYLYFDFMDPYPHISKYHLEISEDK